MFSINERIDINENDGLWIENNINKMIELGIELLKDKNLLIQKGEAGKVKVKSLYSTSVIMNKLDSVYKRLIS